MADCTGLAAVLSEAPCILDPDEVAEILQVSVLEVRRLAKHGELVIFRPEADPDEECILRADVIAYLAKSI